MHLFSCTLVIALCVLDESDMNYILSMVIKYFVCTVLFIFSLV